MLEEPGQDEAEIEITETMIQAGERRLLQLAGAYLARIEDRVPELAEEVLRAALLAANRLGPVRRSEAGKPSFLPLT